MNPHEWRVEVLRVHKIFNFVDELFNVEVNIVIRYDVDISKFSKLLSLLKRQTEEL